MNKAFFIWQGCITLLTHNPQRPGKILLTDERKPYLVMVGHSGPSEPSNFDSGYSFNNLE